MPAPLPICRETRNQGLYQQAFTVLCTFAIFWSDLNIDVISIETVRFSVYKSEMPMIQRLRFKSERLEYLGYWESDNLHSFVNDKEIHGVCMDGMWSWHHAIQYFCWPCELENVFMIDLDDDRTIRGIEMDGIFEQEFEKADDPRHSKSFIPLVMSSVGNYHAH
jgi:hypothetical protein